MDELSLTQAMRELDRRRFLPKRQWPWAGEDRPLPIGSGQTNSQPSTVRDQVLVLDPRPGMSVLDVGAGSAWTTAILARLVGPQGRVIGVEIDEKIAEFGARNLARCAMPWAEYHKAAADTLGWPDAAPYDRILVSAESDEIPDDLIAQLGPAAQMVIVVRGVMLRVLRRTKDADPIITEHGHYRFVPLR